MRLLVRIHASDKGVHPFVRGIFTARLASRPNRLLAGACAFTHLAAFFRASTTGFRTSSTMFVVMFFAFCGAGITNGGTDVAEFRAKF